jgi:rod shape-determining protein MreD
VKGIRGALVALVVLWSAGVLQANVSLLALGGVAPDVLLVAAVVLSSFSGRRTGTTIGFFAGLIHGSIASSSVGYYIVSRATACFGASWARRLETEFSFWLVGLTTFIATFYIQAFQLLLPPPQNILGSMLDTITIATYNGVLAMPLYALLKKILDPVKI